MKNPILNTKDYSMFKRMIGNRAVTNSRVAVIKESIKQCGWISNPLIVNEKYEVVDGQGRLEALKQLGMPVEYRVFEGLTIKDCMAMNLKPTSWHFSDFIKSYAEQGNESYKRLLILGEGMKIGYGPIVAICDGTYSSTAHSNSADAVREGTFTLNEENFKRAKGIIDYLGQLADVQKKIGGKADMFYTVIAWIISRPNVDKARLRVALEQNYCDIPAVGRAEQSLEFISKAYNKGYAAKSRRDFRYEWNYER